MTEYSKPAGPPLIVNFHNAFIDHLPDGSHRLRTTFDANCQLIKKIAGFGGDAGLAFGIAECYPGADIGAKVNAAFAAGHSIVYITASDTLATTITPPADTTLFKLPDVVLTIATDIAGISIGATAHRVTLVNPNIIGSNNPAHTAQYGLSVNAAATRLIVCGQAKFYQTYRGVQGIGDDCFFENIWVDDAVNVGFYITGTRGCLVNTRATNCGSKGYYLNVVYDTTLIRPRAKLNVGHGFEFVTSADRNRLISPIAEDNSYGSAGTYSGIYIGNGRTRNEIMNAICRAVAYNQQKYGLEFHIGAYDNGVKLGIFTPNFVGSIYDPLNNNHIDAQDD